ncbi:MAG: MSCRAMM family protein [Thermoplasmatota archaeon]
MLRPRVTALALSVLLAGCAGGGGDAPVDDPVPVLEATDTTGVIRVVVYDQAIRPLAGVSVEVLSASGPIDEKATDEDGFAGFEDLQPGSYFVKARKPPLFNDAQQAVEVVAGVDDPAAVKIQLLQRTGDLPFYQEFKIEGFLECSATVGNWCFIANYYPCFVMQTAGQPCTGNLTNDNSYFVLDAPLRGLQRVPDWMQAEMVWESTQALGAEMNFRLDFLSDGAATIDNSTGATGPSPLLIDLDAQELQENEIGTTRFIAIETFHGGLTGATVEQRFTDYVHIFYGYTPPEGWRFTETGAVPQPT